MASGMQSCLLSGPSTATPLAPEVCATMVPGRTAEVAANPETSAGSSVSGTASSRSSALPATSGTGDTGVSGNQRSARWRDARETALHATTTWSTRSSATPNAVPTRPAEMMPTLSRAGRNPSSCTIADDPHKSLDSFQSRGAGTGRSLRLYPAEDANRAVVFASVLTAPASAASGRAGLQPRQQLGDRLAAGLRSVDIQRIGAAMPGRGWGCRRWRRWRRHHRLPVGWRRGRGWYRRRWRRHCRRRRRGSADAGVGVCGAFSGMTSPRGTIWLAPIGFGFADLTCRLDGAGMAAAPLNRRRRRRRGFTDAGRTVRSPVAGRGVVVFPRPAAGVFARFGIPVTARCSGGEPLSFGAHRLPGRGRFLMPGLHGGRRPLAPRLFRRRLGRRGWRYKPRLGLWGRLLPPVRTAWRWRLVPLSGARG